MAGFIINNIPSLTEDEITRRFRYLFELKQTQKLTKEETKEYEKLGEEMVSKIDELWRTNLPEVNRIRKEQWRERHKPKQEVPEQKNEMK